ncbi:hypothetical protein M422DRAFT_248517 [Sphaerobolus stellatus SS14]|uniref:Myb-like domain-containing protein n=1 Tax=Sphaerobolus stellatus (strain SS14) TaxID=990650 RepID=A0A0C9W4R4_SPHS4|nr:hypothetical protein M422DRAFT_248517 [Sphaerobolus stellatus SS14]
MVSTCSKAHNQLQPTACQPTPEWRQSPTWDCEEGSLPCSEESANGDNIQSESERPSSPAVEGKESSASIEEVSIPNSQSKNASSPSENRRDTLQAWEQLADTLRKDSRRTGTMIERTGPACRQRFKKILQAHKQNETRSLQKTGTDEEVDEHVQNMTDIVALVDAHEEEKTQKSLSVKQRKSTEKEAALELRKASMLGIVNREKLSNVSQLDGALVREKQGQRKRKRQSAGSSDDNKENIPTIAKRSRGQSAIERVLEQRQVEDTKLLQEVCEREDCRQQEIVGGIDRLSNSIAALVDLNKAQIERENERKADERARESQIFDLMKTVLQQKNNCSSSFLSSSTVISSQIESKHHLSSSSSSTGPPVKYS